MQKVYVALNSTPDYSSGGIATFRSVHRTFEGATAALYPVNTAHQESFMPSAREGIWFGPDGFGEIRLVNLYD